METISEILILAHAWRMHANLWINQ
jgi:hypothetical protein